MRFPKAGNRVKRPPAVKWPRDIPATFPLFPALAPGINRILSGGSQIAFGLFGPKEESVYGRRNALVKKFLRFYEKVLQWPKAHDNARFSGAQKGGQTWQQ